MGAVLAFIGKVLLIILCILLFLILLVGLVLFVPIRYKAYMEKREDIEVKLRISWLLSIIHVSFDYKDGEPNYKIRLFGIINVVNLFKRKKKKDNSRDNIRSNSKDNNKDGSIEHKADSSRKVNSKNTYEKNLAKEEGGSKNISDGAVSEKDGEILQDKVSNEEALDRKVSDKKELEKKETDKKVSDKNISDKKETDKKETDKKETDQKETDQKETDKKVSYKKEIDQKELDKNVVDRKVSEKEILDRENEYEAHDSTDRKKGIVYKLKEIAGFIRKCIDTLKKVIEKLSKLKDKAADIKNKSSIIKEFIFSEYIKGIICIVRGNVLKLLRKIKPRKLKSDIVFGLGDPCLTGEMLGLIAIFMSVTGIAVNVVPDFDRQILEGRLEIAGKIRLFTLIRIVLSIIMSKEWKSFYKEAMRIKEEL